jgi:hypothetical protein
MSIDDWKSSARGRLLSSEEYTPDEFGTWRVLGEDDNPDLHGRHHEPPLGTFTGLYKEVVETAVSLQRFFTWGSGGRIIKENTIKVNAPKTGSIPMTREPVWVVVDDDSQVTVFSDKNEAYDFANQTSLECEEYTALINPEGKAFILDQEFDCGSRGWALKRPDPQKLRDEALRKAALSKLTEEERRVLGVSL